MELPKRHQVAEVASPPAPWAEACHPSVPRVIPLNSMLSEDQSIFYQLSDTQGFIASLVEPIAQPLLFINILCLSPQGRNWWVGAWQLILAQSRKIVTTSLGFIWTLSWMLSNWKSAVPVGFLPVLRYDELRFVRRNWDFKVDRISASSISRYNLIIRPLQWKTFKGDVIVKDDVINVEVFMNAFSVTNTLSGVYGYFIRVSNPMAHGPIAQWWPSILISMSCQFVMDHDLFYIHRWFVFSQTRRTTTICSSRLRFKCFPKTRKKTDETWESSIWLWI